jgi:hypothetical protein
MYRPSLHNFFGVNIVRPLLEQSTLFHSVSFPNQIDLLEHQGSYRGIRHIQFILRDLGVCLGQKDIGGKKLCTRVVESCRPGA